MLEFELRLLRLIPNKAAYSKTGQVLFKTIPSLVIYFLTTIIFPLYIYIFFENCKPRVILPFYIYFKTVNCIGVHSERIIIMQKINITFRHRVAALQPQLFTAIIGIKKASCETYVGTQNRMGVYAYAYHRPYNKIILIVDPLVGNKREPCSLLAVVPFE